MREECTHDWQPVNNTPAVYRCSACGMFAYKKLARIGFGSTEMTPYKCYVTGCQEPVIVLWPVVRAIKRHQPSCQQHRKDLPK